MANGAPDSSRTTRPRPVFLVTIDVEGDNLWAKPRTVTTRNAESLPRFHALCAKHGLRPTYLADYDMVRTPAFVGFGREVIRTGAGEIGMHLHAWSTPPIVPLTRDDRVCQPYLMEYPQRIMAEKIARLSGLLEETFGVRMRSHRAGRWGLNEAYAQALIARRYSVDCSVTPGVSWRRHLGNPDGAGGPDYRHFRGDAYFLDPDDISRSGSSPLLEVPMTVLRSATSVPSALREVFDAVPVARKALHRIAPAVRWLRPNGRNGKGLLRTLDEAIAAGRSHVMFMLHSSELMAGGSPNFPTERSIDALYADLEDLFARVPARCRAATLSEYYDMTCTVALSAAHGPNAATDTPAAGASGR